MLYFVRILATSRNHTFIWSGSSQRALWKSYARDIRVLSSGRRCTKREAQCLPTGPARRVTSKEFAISSTPRIRGGNPRVSRSRIYRTSVSSSLGVNWWRPLRLSAREVVPFIRRRIELSGMSYVFAARRMDIFLVVRIASMARMTLLSFVRTDISRVCRKGGLCWEVAVLAKSAQGDGVRRVMVDHVIINFKYKLRKYRFACRRCTGFRNENLQDPLIA
jgi:hypothetical protein